jgi:hypothetical protein
MPLKNNRSKKKLHFLKKKNKSKRGGRGMGETSSSSVSGLGSGSSRKSSSSSENSSSSSEESSSSPSSSSSSEESSSSSSEESSSPSSSSSSEESSSSSSISSLPSASASSTKSSLTSPTASSSRRSSIGINSGDIMDATIVNQDNPQGSPSGENLSNVALMEELLKESGLKLPSSTRSSSAKTSPVKVLSARVPSARVSSAKVPSKQMSVRENSGDIVNLPRGVTCLRRDYNPKSKRCLIPCKNGQARNPNNNRCGAMPKNNGPNLRQSMANLPVENIGNGVPPCGGRTEDFNPRTKRCLKPCESNTRRNQQTMRCVKVLNVAPAQEVRSRQASIRRSPSREAIVVGQEAQEMFPQGVAAEPVQQMQRAQSPKKMTLKQKNTLKRFNQNSSQNSTRKVIHLLARRYQFDPVDATTYINKKLAIKTRYSE